MAALFMFVFTIVRKAVANLGFQGRWGGGGNPKEEKGGCAPTYDLTRFFQKLHENIENLEDWGVLLPLLICQSKWSHL